MYRNMKNSERLRLMHHLSKKYRGMCGDPSEETKRAWEEYDRRQEWLIWLYERREADEAAKAAAAKEADEIILTTEVKIK